MKKIIFISMYILLSTLYADLTEWKMEKYWENSIAKYMFMENKKMLEIDLFNVVHVKKEKAKQILLKNIDTFVNNPKYLKIFKENIFSMDTSVYKKLNEFYNTNLGKKYRKIINFIDYRSYEYVKSEYRNLMKNNIISKEKIKLIYDIDNELNLVEEKINFKKKFTIFQKRILYPDDNITDEIIEKNILQYSSFAKKYESMLMPILFRDFTENELRELLSYASSKILTIEIEYIYRASLELSKQSYLDLKDNIERLILIGFCQKYPVGSKIAPDECKILSNTN